MSIAEFIFTAIVAVVGVPSALKNPTAAALVGAWLFSQLLYWFTGNGLATEYYAYPDAAVIAVIMTKSEACNFEIQDTIWGELKCAILERSVEDRLILCSFPICWYFYVADIAPFYTYWALWLLAAAQFFAAGHESLSRYIHRRAEMMNAPPVQTGDKFVAYPAGGWSEW
ncbi:MAG: hypothetical protein ACJ8FS_16355 [Sphingomicrobium sp.]